ncbi:glycosyltransferase family 4 protein [Actinomyces slackii]|uniref:Glycogen synthase n=1 Tax=Actinomyces slackii TaxID=52774 RepID=A0A448KD82_9ACTO|nr:glycosyltransferase family 4 protein [Actinomyces slackii]VEG74894.1 Glycogen synthase [Actinomyces slackii]
MRVLIVSDCYPPRLGGIETQVRDLALNLRAAGHEPTVVTATPVGRERGRSIETQDGFPVWRTTVPLPAELPVHPLARREIGVAMDRLRPEVVHVHVGIVSPFAWSGIAAAQSRGLPLLITFHCVLGPWARAGALAGALSPVRRWQRAGAHLTAVSSMLVRQVEAAGGRDVDILPNGITVADWRLPQDWQSPDHSPDRPLTVTASQRWIGRKRPLQVVRAFADAVQAVGDERAVLMMYGDGPLRQRLAREVEGSGVAERIVLVGRLERPELARALNRGDIFLQTSTDDSFGIAVLEARTAGLAIIARRSSGVSDFIEDGVEGLLVDDEPELARALETLLTDRQMLERIRAHNRAVAPAVEWAAVVGMHEEAYRRAIAAARG